MLCAFIGAASGVTDSAIALMCNAAEVAGVPDPVVMEVLHRIVVAVSAGIHDVCVGAIAEIIQLAKVLVR